MCESLLKLLTWKDFFKKYKYLLEIPKKNFFYCIPELAGRPVQLPAINFLKITDTQNYSGLTEMEGTCVFFKIFLSI